MDRKEFEGLWILNLPELSKFSTPMLTKMRSYVTREAPRRLRRQKIITDWYDRDIGAGRGWDDESKRTSTLLA
ncbi:MAG: hypothetical protein QOJ64_3693 [Acidobacteriota bacterium]|jgi:hypothetical protein|nr:hypothetical protein [Acidobacteriota bacterium]